MNSVMLNYDDFDLETATADRYSLHDAAQKAEEVRSKSPDVFARIKSVDGTYSSPFEPHVAEAGLTMSEKERVPGSL
jgi:hypothetical protein